MTKTKLFLLIQSALCVLLTILLAAAAIGIYREGAANRAEHPLEPIYTREKAAERLAPILPLFFGALGLTVTGLLLDIRGSHAPVRDAELARDLLVSRVAEPDETMKRERSGQRVLSCLGWVLFALSLAPAAVYLTSLIHLPAGDPETMVASLAAVLLLWTALGFGCMSVCAVLRDRSLRREAAAAKALLREESRAGVRTESGIKESSGTKLLGTLRAALLLAALLFLLLGIANGGARDVLYKAARICTECVGLG